MRWKYFDWMFASTTQATAIEAKPLEDRKLFVTGEELIERIVSAVTVRRPVLVTGPRGCGKSYCTKKALERARDGGHIAGWHFVQGNRELSRDYLSEDSLVIESTAEPKLLDALALRPPSRPDSRYADMREVRREGNPTWPGVPTGHLHRRDELWAPHDGVTPWVALFLDEINRFSDGFLDSLLSLLEEGSIVRRGEELYVPIVVVATANPPGYDITAKKLSPPLQARIARSYRVSQPPLDHLVQVVLAEKVAGKSSNEVPNEVRYRAAAATLCLWGDPDALSKGTSFLTPGTKKLLRRAMACDPILAGYMRQISTYVQFGPDARAVSDWVECSTSLMGATGPAGRKAEDFYAALAETAAEVLVHKLRETFNEGAEPEKPPLLERLVLQIVRRVLFYPGLMNVFVMPYARARKHIGAIRGEPISDQELFKKICELPESRWHEWLDALANDRLTSKEQLNDWITDLKKADLIAADDAFVSELERRWLLELLGDGEIPIAIDVRTPRTPRAAAKEALDRSSFLQAFAPDLLELVQASSEWLAGDAKHCGAWVDLLEDLLDANVPDFDDRWRSFLSEVKAKVAFKRLLGQAVELLLHDLGGPKDVVNKQLERLRSAKQGLT